MRRSRRIWNSTIRGVVSTYNYMWNGNAMRPNQMELMLESISNACCMHVGVLPDASHCSVSHRYPAGSTHGRIARTLAAIHDRLDAQWTVRSLAAVAGMSRSTFILHFSALMGMPPVHYVTAWKVTRARQLLQEQRLSVAAVTEMLGYSSEAAFRKVFKRVTGMGPGRARAAVRFNRRSETDARARIAAAPP